MVADEFNRHRSGGLVPPIRKTPGVCGGAPCVRETRIPVWTLVRLSQLGASDADLLDSYPSLSPSDLLAARDYYEQHAMEIDDAIAAEESETPSGEAVRR